MWQWLVSIVSKMDPNNSDSENDTFPNRNTLRGKYYQIEESDEEHSENGKHSTLSYFNEVISQHFINYIKKKELTYVTMKKTVLWRRKVQTTRKVNMKKRIETNRKGI